MNTLIASIWVKAQSVLAALAMLIILAEGEGTGPEKKARAVGYLDAFLAALPFTGVAWTVTRTAAHTLAPVAIDLIVGAANSQGLLPKSSPPTLSQS